MLHKLSIIYDFGQLPCSGYGGSHFLGQRSDTPEMGAGAVHLDFGEGWSIEGEGGVDAKHQTDPRAEYAALKNRRPGSIGLPIPG